MQPYFICFCPGFLFSLLFFNVLLNSWIPSPKRVGSRPMKCSVSAANSAPCTIRYLIALWWLWLMMFSTSANSSEKHTSPIRWTAYKWTPQTWLQQTVLENRSSYFYYKAYFTPHHTHTIHGDTTFIIYCLKQECLVDGRLGSHAMD